MVMLKTMHVMKFYLNNGEKELQSVDSRGLCTCCDCLYGGCVLFQCVGLSLLCSAWFCHRAAKLEKWQCFRMVNSEKRVSGMR